MAKSRNKVVWIHQTTYPIWRRMKRRCFDTNSKDYKNYGGRGITVSKSWLNFDNFFADINETYKQGLTLERIDNNKGYSKENCKWATMKVQQNNRRNNRLIEYKGIKQSLLAWANYLNIKRSTLAQRFYVYKWPLERCLQGEY